MAMRPTFHKHGGTLCGGVQVHVTDHEAFRPYLTGVAMLRALRRRWPEQLAWRHRAYEFVDDIPAIDLLTGGATVRCGIDAGASLDELAASWRPAEDQFREHRRAFLLYD